MIKRKPWRSAAYTKWVKTLPCCFCGMGPSDAHQSKGVA